MAHKTVLRRRRPERTSSSSATSRNCEEVWDYGTWYCIRRPVHGDYRAAVHFGTIQQNSHGMTPLVYIIGFVAILFTAMSYMRMSKRFPIAGSVYSYVQRGINPHVGFMAGWLILLDYVLVPSLLIVMVMNWGVALVPGSPAWLWAVAFIAFNTFVNIRGIQMSRGVDWVIFIVEIVAVVAFIAFGTNFVLGGGGAGGFVPRPDLPTGSGGRALRGGGHLHRGAFVPGLRRHVHAGRGNARAREEHRQGHHHPLSIIIVVFVAQTYHRRHRAARLGGHRSRHGLLRFRLPGGRAGVLQDHVAGQHRRGGHRQHHQRAQMASSRLLYSMGRDGVIPRVFGKVHPKFQTPWFASPSSWARSRCAAALPLQDYMGTLAGFVNFGALSSFILLNFAVFWFFFVKQGRSARRSRTS